MKRLYPHHEDNATRSQMLNPKLQPRPCVATVPIYTKPSSSSSGVYSIDPPDAHWAAHILQRIFVVIQVGSLSPNYIQDCADRPLSILLTLPPSLRVACDEGPSAPPSRAVRLLALRLAASICILVCLCICRAYCERSRGVSSDESCEKWDRGDWGYSEVEDILGGWGGWWW